MKVFIDTNVLIYWVDAGPRADVAEDLLAGDAVVSVQVLNEFADVLRKKRQMPIAAVRELTGTLIATCEVAELTVRTHQAAPNLAERYGFSVYSPISSRLLWAMAAKWCIPRTCSMAWRFHRWMVPCAKCPMDFPFATHFIEPMAEEVGASASRK